MLLAVAEVLARCRDAADEQREVFALKVFLRIERECGRACLSCLNAELLLALHQHLLCLWVEQSHGHGTCHVLL